VEIQLSQRLLHFKTQWLYLDKKESEVKKMIEENFNKLVKLKQEHPTRPVIPLVGTGVVADSMYDVWLGQIGESRLERMYIGEDQVHFDEDHLIEIEAEHLWLDRYDGKEISEAEEKEIRNLAEEKVRKLKWEDVIVVNIVSP